MNVKKVVLALGAGVAIGYIAKKQVDNYQQLSPEKALKHAKETFKRQGPISGSWIYMKPEEIEKNGLSYTAYRGGVTRNIEGENKQFEFHIDVDTGAVIDTVPST